MNNQIIDIEAEVTPEVDPKEKVLKLIDELNQKISDNSGQWIYDEKLGLIWQPNISPIPSNQSPETKVSQPATPPLLESLVQWGKTFDFDNLKKNSVIIIKLDISDPIRTQMMQRIIAKQVLEPRVEKLKANQVCVLFIQSGDDISVLSEEDMNAAGWEKKDKPRIITLS